MTDLKDSEAMGGRGAFDRSMGKTGGIPIEKSEYSTIGYIDKIKIIQCDTKTNNPTTTYSNTCNTTYYAYSKEYRRIEKIYYFRNHKLVKSVDFKDVSRPHVHYWNNRVVGRKSHDAHNTFELNNRDLRLMSKALIFNRQHNGKQKAN